MYATASPLTDGARGQAPTVTAGLKWAPDKLPVGKGKDHDGQPVSEGDRSDTVEPGPCPDHSRGPSADEHERESADELRKKLGGKVVLHFDLRTKRFSHLALSPPGRPGRASFPTR